MSLIERLRGLIKINQGNRPVEEDVDLIKKVAIVKEAQETPGKYLLAYLAFEPTGPLNHTGFSYGYNLSYNGEVIKIPFFKYNRWGIIVQGHDSNYQPKIEIKKDDNSIFIAILHLPEGYKIPVGPVMFESDSIPISEGDNEIETEFTRAIYNPKGKENLSYLDKFSVNRRKYTERFFYWQPELGDEPTRIAINFDEIKPYYMGLSLEGAPTFSYTKVYNKDNI